MTRRSVAVVGAGIFGGTDRRQWIREHPDLVPK